MGGFLFFSSIIYQIQLESSTIELVQMRPGDVCVRAGLVRFGLVGAISSAKLYTRLDACYKEDPVCFDARMARAGEQAFSRQMSACSVQPTNPKESRPLGPNRKSLSVAASPACCKPTLGSSARFVPSLRGRLASMIQSPQATQDLSLDFPRSI
ncbi:hypothetical protein LX36DRAFT_334335 [Colletotrichum falcatum]|nr:hypothetical protein LX36DRAFT_334335 [Colletotrichum falcatum]